MQRRSYISDYMELPKRIHLDENTEITGELIKRLLDDHQENIERYEKLQDYYKGKTIIFDRLKDPKYSNNRLTFDYAGYIVDTLLGLFVGKPITYTSNTENDQYMANLQAIFDANDEQDENTELAKMMGINGRAYEIVYTDESGDICFNEILPQNIIFVYDNKIKPQPLFALYIQQGTFDQEDDNTIVAYTKSDIITYKTQGGRYTEETRTPHAFGDVPVIEFMNNDEGIGDFEKVIHIIDEYNLLQSDTANDFEEFTNAILCLYGLLGTTDEDKQRIYEDRLLLLDADAGQDAKYLIKEINDTALAGYKATLEESIHKFAKVPNMSDEHFAGNVSGEAMKFKLFTTDQAIAQKQRKFKTALTQRLYLITNVMRLKAQAGGDYKDIQINFNKNTPYNELDNALLVKTLLDTGASRQLAFSKLRDLDDIGEELRLQDEELDPYADYQDQQPLQNMQELTDDEE